jgi:acetyl-CoA carboxylase biotin carboxyl carrier protein
MVKSSDLTVDGDLVRALAALLRETGLSEIEYAVGDRRIRVVRDPPASTASAPPAAVPMLAAAAPVAEAVLAGAVTAPMVGTAYLAPQPGSPPFVTLGEQVAEGQVLLLIEAMKVMNQIPAPRAGRLARILIADGAPVEFGQALMVLV